MPLVRSQEDEIHTQFDVHATSIARWRVSTPYSQPSYDLRTSFKPPSRNPRSLRKAASWTAAAHRVVLLERIQEDEDDDVFPSYQPRLPQIPMETFQMDEANVDAYTCPAWSSPEGLDSPVLNSPTHDLTNPLLFIIDDSENLLRRYRRDPRNIILDSVQPETIPHIVITPSEFSWTEFSIMDENHVPSQHPEDYLCVPGSGSTSLFATILPNETADQDVEAETLHPKPEELENCTQVDDPVFVDDSRPPGVFSPSLLVEMVEAASQEREFLPHLPCPLYKRLFSICATLASDMACGLQSRYSSSATVSELFSHLETPVTWSDPALPLLSWYFRLPGAIIIDSITPFTIPHIVITEPPTWDYNPYVNLHNSTQSPQDARWGQSLVVPSPVVDFVNLPEDVASVEPASGYSIATQHMELETEGDVSEPESPSEDSIIGSPESTVIQTPSLLTPIGEEEEFDLVMFASSSPQDPYLPLAEDDELLLEDGPQEIEIYCDDEDDDLPPLDSWYQDIATRSGYTLST